MKIGITERGDAALDQSWVSKVGDFDGVILITKAPQSLPEIPDNAIVHCTITGFGGTALEPGVAPTDVTIPAYQKIVEEIGSQRTVLRIDPIIPTEKGLKRARDVFYKTQSRVRISFIDVYRHIQIRFDEAGMPPVPSSSFHFPLWVRQKAAETFPHAEICGEPGFKCVGCVSKKDLDALGLKNDGLSKKISTQRDACACLAVKTEMLNRRRQCAHGCLYCYWR